LSENKNQTLLSVGNVTKNRSQTAVNFMLIQWYLEDLFSKQLLIGQINTAMR